MRDLSTLLETLHCWVFWLLKFSSYTNQGGDGGLVTKSRLTFWNPFMTLARFFCPWDFPGKNIGVVAISYSREPSRPRDRTCISCIAGGVITD